MDAYKSSEPTLHVFQQDGAWHWGITIERPTGIGMKVVAYSDEGFTTEEDARDDGERVLRAGEWKAQAPRHAEASRV